MASIGCTRLILPFPACPALVALALARRNRQADRCSRRRQGEAVPCARSGRARSPSGWSRSRSSSTPPPRRRTSPSTRCTARTAAGSGTSGSATIDGEEVPYARHRQGLRAAERRDRGAHRRGLRRPAADHVADDRRARSSCRSSRSTRSTSRRPTTWSRSKTGDQAVRAAARRARGVRPGRAGQGRAAPAGVAGDAAGARRRASCWRRCSGRTRSATPDFAFLDEDVDGPARRSWRWPSR